jgi:hypothetical protein
MKEQVDKVIKQGFRLSGQIYSAVEFTKANYVDEVKDHLSNPRRLYQLVMSDHYRSKGEHAFEMWFKSTYRITRSL